MAQLIPDNSRQNPRFRVWDDRVYERRLVHQFRMNDCEDPDLYMAQPLYEWQQGEQGQWVMTHGRDPFWTTQPDYATYGYRVAIWAWIEPRRWTEWCLRWPPP